MSEQASYVSTTHTVAELKVMCKENGLSVSGKKADLIERLNQHFTEDSISLEDDFQEPTKEESISLEDVKSVPLPKVDDDEILVAEFIDAEIIESEDSSKSDNDVNVSRDNSSTTLIQQLKNPKIAAVLMTILVATGGWYWYASNQLEPFVADDLRYGCLLYTSPSPRDP